MVIIRVKGGLGNQMFQYAIGRRLAIEREEELRFDLSWFDLQEKRRFELHQFSIPETIPTGFPFPLSLQFSNYSWIRRFASILPKYPGLKSPSCVKETHSGIYDPCIFDVEGDLILDGYWQSLQYFEPIANLIRSEFLPRHPLSEEDKTLVTTLQEDPFSVCVHVRRGDYVNDPKTMAVHYVCTPDYYHEALRLMKKELGCDIRPYFFSDDPGWVREEFSYDLDDLTVLSRERSSAQEIHLMSQCSHFIIANSSFSWWAAWLATNPGKRVIAPEKWFFSQDAPDVVPEEWIRMRYESG